MARGFCSLCGHAYNDWPTHFAGAEHQRRMHPIGSRKGARASARRERARAHRRTSTAGGYRREQNRQADYELADQRAEQKRTGRHYYGRWTPFGVSAFMGGHPARVLGHAHRHVRRHIRRFLVDE